MFGSLVQKGLLDYSDTNDNGEIYRWSIPVDEEVQSQGCSLEYNNKPFRPFGNSEDWSDRRRARFARPACQAAARRCPGLLGDFSKTLETCAGWGVIRGTVVYGFASTELDGGDASVSQSR